MKFYNILFALITLTLCAGNNATGKTVDENTARTAGINFLAGKGITVPGMVTAYTATGIIDGTTVASYYVFNVTGSHTFVIIAADDIITPVLAYSAESAFDLAHMPPVARDWIDGYRKQITAAIAANAPAKAATTAAWSALKAGVPSQAAARTTAVTPLLGTLVWDQAPYAGFDPGGYYNDSCPGADANQAPTGCVATAMAQVMKYWNWPTVGTGYFTYPCTTYYTGHTGLDSAVQLSADFGNTVYGWDSMQTPKETTHDPALAQLMFHAGVSLSMQYDTTASGSYVLESETYPYTQCAEYALKTYFHYARTLHGYTRDGIQGDGIDTIAEATWIAMLQTELNARRPVIYDGDGAEGSHCWVCDGWETTGTMFHFNWGWSGDADGYYTVDNLAPTGSGYTFNSDQGAIIGIQPDSFPNTPGGIQLLAHLNSLNSTPMNYGTPVFITTTIFNADSTSFTGAIAMQVFDTANNLVGTIQTYTGQTIAAGHNTTYTFGPSVMYGMVPMDYYHIQAMYQPIGDLDWMPVANNGIYINYTTADVSNDTDITLNESIAVTTPLPVISGAALTLNTQLINYSRTGFNGTVEAVMINVVTGIFYLVDSLTGQAMVADTSFTTTYPLNTTFTNISFTAPDGLYALVIRHQYNGTGGFYTTGSTQYENPVIVQVGANVSVPQVTLAPDVYVFPDPAKDRFTILPQGVGITAVSMFDILGRRVQQQIQPNGRAAINVPANNLAPGEYIIRLQTDTQQTITKKVVIAQ